MNFGPILECNNQYLTLKPFDMKKYLTLFMVIAGSAVMSAFLSSCEGPMGPPGPTGPPGQPGADGLIGAVFEAQIDFTPGNDHSQVVPFPGSIDVFDSDVVVAYILTAVDNGTDVWEPLPQTLFFVNDILLYGYDYTSSDIRFFLDGTVNFAALDPFFTDGVIFRVAIIPADFAKEIDLSKMEDVISAMKVDQVVRVN